MGHKVRIWETGPYYGREGFVLDFCTDKSNIDNAYYVYYTIGFNEADKPSFVPDHKFLHEDLEVID